MICIPYIHKNGKVYSRTTEVTGVMECEEKAHHMREQQIKLEKGELKTIATRTTFSAVRGTTAHLKIENWIRNFMKLPELEFKLNPADQRLYNRIMNNKKQRDKFNKEVSNAFMNFITWWQEYEPTPLVVEQTLFDTVKGRKIKGTVDFICLIEEGKLDQAHKQPTRSSTKGIKRLMIVDWKTGKNPLEGHKAQIAAYFYMANRTALIPFLRKHDHYTLDKNNYGIDVYLGGKEPRTEMFKIEKHRFFASVDLFEKAETNPVNRTKGGLFNEGFGMTCYFCPFTDRCSMNLTTEMTVNDLSVENDQTESIKVLS